MSFEEQIEVLIVVVLLLPVSIKDLAPIALAIISSESFKRPERREPEKVT